jgi:hypothetical protein
MSSVLLHHSKYTEDDDHLSFFQMCEDNDLTAGSEISQPSVDYGIYSTQFFKIFFFWFDLFLIEHCRLNIENSDTFQV